MIDDIRTEVIRLLDMKLEFEAAAESKVLIV